MKKSHIVGGIVVLGAALAFVVYINKSPNKSSSAQIAAANDGSAPAEVDSRWELSGNSGSLDSSGAAIPTPAGGQDSKSAKIDNFISRSRVAEEFRFLDEQMEIQFEHMRAGATPEEIATFEELRSKLKGEDLLAKYKDALKESFSDAELDHLNEIEQNPAYMRYKDAEAYNRSPQGMKDLAEYSRTFKAENLPAERRAALQELVDASGAAEQMKGMLKGVEGLLGAPQGKASNKEVAQYEKVLQESINNALVLTYAKNFDGQPDAEINGLAQTMADKTRQKASDIKIGLLTKEMVDAVKPQLDKALAGTAAGR